MFLWIETVKTQMQVYKDVGGGEGNWAQKVQTGFPILWEPTEVVQAWVSQILSQKIGAYSLEVYHVRLKSFVLNHLNKRLGNDSSEEIQFLEPNGPENI